MNFVDCDKVRVDYGKYGFGVFARQNFKEGDIIETGIMMRLTNVDGNINSHLFTWSDDRKVFAAGSGCLPFYNHSYTPNVAKVGDLANDRMKIVALRDITMGEELFNRYMSALWRTCFSEFDN